MDPESPVGTLPRITISTQDGSTSQPDDDNPTSPTLLSVSPPSPTLSTGSVRFNNTTSLRDNHPTLQSGAESLVLLGNTSHQRKPSLSTNPDFDVPLTPIPTGTTKGGNSALDDPETPRAKTAQAPLPDEPIDPTPYAFDPNRLARLVANNAKDIDALEEMGGANGLCNGLGTDRARGLSAAALSSESSDPAVPPPTKEGSAEQSLFTVSIDVRKRIYGSNVLPIRPSKTLLQLMWLALKDKVLVLLCIAAVVSLALGLYSDFGVKHPPVICPSNGLLKCSEPKVEWVEGVAIMVAVLIVVLVGSLNDWQKERQFRALNDKKDDRTLKVIRDGQECVINVKDVVVGDIALLEPGEIIPVDGVFIKGHNVVCDEAGATGESNTIKKITYEETIDEKRAGKLDITKRDCFLISGAKVLEGVGEYVVIAIGPRSFNGRILMELRGETENTPLQIKLNALAELIAKLGSLAGLVLFTALMIRFFVHLKTDPHRSASDKAMEFTQILIIAVTVIVVAVPEGLPLAVTLALAFATKRMTKEKLLVRHLGACEIMANASVVCTDKTGTLTTNVMTVVAGCVGVHGKFARESNTNRQNVGNVTGEDEGNKRHWEDFALDLKEINNAISEPLLKVFNDAITINSTAFEDKDPDSGELEFVGSKTETALLGFAKSLEWPDYRERRAAVQTMQMIPFSSERKCMGIVIGEGDRYRVYFKGASEILVNKCTKHVVVHKPGSEPIPTESKEPETKEINENEKENLSRTIIFYANQSLRTIAICYRDLPEWPLPGPKTEAGDVPFEALFDDLTLIAITAIEDPLRPGVAKAVADCNRAGVSVKMCTGDNILTARSIAYQCGIFTPGGIIMDGPTFRNLSDQERIHVVPRLQVLARSSPLDKKVLVETLKSLGEIVGVTGDGTNDGPALKTAHVGFSMGIAGTEVAKEASDIILMDDNFASIVSAIMWGRCVNDAVRKFLQFQISVNITAVIITFVSAVASSSESSVLTAVQLLWINIIMDTFAALALATDPATPDMLDRKPDRKTAPLFNTAMRMQILGQALYQTFIILLFHFASDAIFSYDKSAYTEAQIQQWHSEVNTLVFNAFVFCQIFNSVNSRRIDSRKNVFRGILLNWYFLIITAIEVGAQVLIVFVGGAAFSVHELSGRSWGVSLALGSVSLPLGFLIRCIPEAPVERLFRKLRIMSDQPVLPDTSPEKEQQQWNTAIDTVRDNLRTFANIRGGRVRASSFVRKSRSARLQEAGIQLPSLLAMVPTLVMSSIGAGWQPQAGSMTDPCAHDPSKSSAALYAGGKIQMHPETAPEDPFYAKYGSTPSSNSSHV
ncbi:hypothetical protein FRB99_008229 [Tulasnella sp. 403]|nr:hypothetical protein FRB99_008229 [Tulasnella sp. 403]